MFPADVEPSCESPWLLPALPEEAPEFVFVPELVLVSVFEPAPDAVFLPDPDSVLGSGSDVSFDSASRDTDVLRLASKIVPSEALISYSYLQPFALKSTS